MIVLAVFVLGTAAILYAVSPEAFIIVFWGGGWALMIRAGKKMPPAPNPAPPPPLERGSVEGSQVTLIRDQTHPNRWIITRPSRWLTADTDKTGTS